MRKSTTMLAAPVLALSLSLTACGGDSNSTSNAGASGSAASGASTASAAASTGDAASQCPTDNTQKFAKTRFVTNVGLAGGSFYQWIYKPYQAGKFKQGADGRTVALVKAAAAGAFAAKQVKDATNNVKADPTLCKAFIGPMTKLQNQLETVGTKIRSGDVSGIADTAATVGGISSLAKQNGLNIDMSKSGM